MRAYHNQTTRLQHYIVTTEKPSHIDQNDIDRTKTFLCIFQFTPTQLKSISQGKKDTDPKGTDRT